MRVLLVGGGVMCECCRVVRVLCESTVGAVEVL